MTDDNNSTPLVDLTTVQEPIRFDSEEDAVFGSSSFYRQLFKKQVFRLKQNDANFCMLSVFRRNLSDGVCDRIGFYLWRSSHIKNLTLPGCGLSEAKMGKLFSRIVDQHEQNDANDYLKKHDILEKILNVGETSLAGNIMGYLALTPFTKLFHVNLSDNYIGTNGLDLLVKALTGADAPVRELCLSRCGLEDLSPLMGTRKLKQLKELELNHNDLRSTAENAQALSVLLDGGYPRLKKLFLGECGIDSELLEKAAPSLLSNKSLWHFHLINNPIGDRGIDALTKAICDSTSFEKILASNHTILKIIIGGDMMSSKSEQKLQRLSMINYYVGLVHDFDSLSPAVRKQKIYKMACRKLFTLLAGHEDIDPSLLLHFDIGLLPTLFFKLLNELQYPLGEKELLTAFYKILKCKVFREKLEFLSQISKLQASNEALSENVEENLNIQRIKERNEQLEAENVTLLEENRRLKEQISSLMAQNRPDSKSEAEQNVGSIAERVKMRANSRKRARV